MTRFRTAGIRRSIFVTRALRWLGRCAAIGALGGLAACSTLQVRESDYDPNTLFGNYLIARYAAAQRETAVAADHYQRALTLQPENTHLIERSFLLAVHDGRIDEAIDLAGQMAAQDPDDRVARLVLALDELKSGRERAALARLEGLSNTGLSGFLEGLVNAWSLAGLKRYDDAIAIVTALPSGVGLSQEKAVHVSALARLNGDAERSLTALEGMLGRSGRQSIRLLQAYVRALADARGETMAALFLAGELDDGTTHPVLIRDLAVLEAGRKLEPLIDGPRAGAAEALFSIARSLAELRSVDLPSFYLQLALYMKPDFNEAYALLGDLHGTIGNPLEAVEAYRAIDENSPYGVYAGLQIASNLQASSDTQGAIETIREVIDRHPRERSALTTLGDLKRSNEDFLGAAEAYERALAMRDTPEPNDWAVYYALGIAYEQADMWPKAEKALQAALELNRHPLVLNYLGYVWADRGENLDEAFAMIREAVDAEPSNGFIIDSLGWAHYRLGNYSEAVRYLERAVQIEPGDSTINDHLGDAYWQVGRKREARFQWRHALDHDPDLDEIDRIKKKLSLGLDAVLAAEENEDGDRAPPSQPVQIES